MHMVAIIKCPAKSRDCLRGGEFSFRPRAICSAAWNKKPRVGGNCGECPFEVLDEMSARGSFRIGHLPTCLNIFEDVICGK